MARTRRPRASSPALADALAWTSLALGAAALAAPDRVARTIGLGEGGRHRDMIRAVGLREVTTGVGLLTGLRPAGWAWARVAGDAMDMALLTGAMALDGTDRGRLGATLLAVGGIAALDIAGTRTLGRDGADAHAAPAAEPGVRFVRTVTINRPRADLYAFWRDLSNLPKVMRHLDSVVETDARRSRWHAGGPAGMEYSWEAEITDDRPNERLAWRSLPGGDVENDGVVSFRDGTGGRGTVLRVELHYVPPFGRIGAAAAKLFGREPSQEVQEDLRRFKSMMETGEVARADSSFGLLGHPARPPG